MRQAAVALLIAALASACANSPGGGKGQPTASQSSQPSPESRDGQVAQVNLAILPSTPRDAQAGAAAVNAFGFDVYKRLRGTNSTADLVLSPTSIALALAMARAGARGQTADEMDQVLHDFGSDDNAAWVAGLEAALNARTAVFPDAAEAPQHVTLHNVHAAFTQTGLSLEDGYLQALATRFAAGVRLVDYKHATEAARGEINGWVAGATEDRIDELIPPGVIDSATRLVLVNAMYLKAAWLSPFLGETDPAPFTLLDGTTVDVPTMHTSGTFPFAESAAWRAIELPYVGEQLGMLIIVPEDLAAFEGTLDRDGFDAILSALDREQVELALPKFGQETNVTLNDHLKALGMPTAFGSADFSGITRDTDLQIATVVHQANIDVDEAGTEAAAATAVALRESAIAPGVVLSVDRPFVFAIRDRATGAILFLGRVTRPSEREG